MVTGMRKKPRTVQQLAATGNVKDAREVIGKRPAGVVVVEVNHTTADHRRPFRRTRRSA